MKHPSRIIAVCALVGSFCLLVNETAHAQAPPEISHLHPLTIGHHEWFWGGAGFPAEMLHTITGENFNDEGTEVLVWEPGERSPDTAQVLKRTLEGNLELPVKPPEDVRIVQPLDIEPQVLMAPLVHPEGRRAYTAAWVRTKAGVSSPILFNVPVPGWIGETTLEQGDLLRIFGHGLWYPYIPERVIALYSETEHTVVELQPYADKGIDKAGEYRLQEAHLPVDLAPGKFRVFLHNGLGGDFGWVEAGEIEVLEKGVLEPPKQFDVRDFGALGDGIANDHSAIQAAIQAAYEAGGGEIVFPVGTFRTDRTIQLRPGVRFQGAGRENTTLEGFGYDPQKGTRRADAPNTEPAPVLTMTDHTGLGKMTIRGMVSHGPVTMWGTGLVCVFPAKMAETPVEPGDVRSHGRYHAMQGGIIRDLFIHDCELITIPNAPNPSYRSAFFVVGIENTERFRLKNSTFHGTISFGRGGTTRTDVVHNRILRGGLSIGAMVDCFLDANFLEDGPGRFYSYRPVRNSYFRSNEIYGFGRRSSAGGAEAFMLHGGHGKIVGSPTSASKTGLTDTSQSWEPNQFVKELRTVVITAGRGFGQYRHITGNSKDTLEIESPWRVLPDETSEYVIGRFFTDSVFFDNYQDHLAQMWLWFDCLNVTVENHRDDGGGGIDLFGIDIADSEKPDRFSPSWFNMLVRNHMHGSRLALWSEDTGTSGYRGPVLFANYLIDNQIVRPGMRPIGDNVRRIGPQAGIDFNYYLMRKHEPGGRITHTVAVRNVISDAAVGIRIPKWATKTFLSGNVFINVQNPILDAGVQSVLLNNVIEEYNPDNGELRSEPIGK